MNTEHLAYSLIQIIHNFGAVFAFGIPFFWLLYKPVNIRQPLMIAIVAIVWAMQGITGGLFLLASIWLYGALPEFTYLGITLIITKSTLAAVTTIYCFWIIYLRKGDGSANWLFLTILATIAIVISGILRWNT